jgi:predicted NUDIX family NTP pyrophosphohydrolase
MESAGLLIYDWFDGQLRVFLVHPGGPYWKGKENEGWGIPKGKLESGEVPIEAAIRETWEETGSFPSGELTHNLGFVRQNKNKTVYCWAWHGRIELPVKSNTVCEEIRGKEVEFPEIDKGAWFTPDEAKAVIIRKQSEFIDRLLAEVGEKDA